MLIMLEEGGAGQSNANFVNNVWRGLFHILTIADKRGGGGGKGPIHAVNN